MLQKKQSLMRRIFFSYFLFYECNIVKNSWLQLFSWLQSFTVYLPDADLVTVIMCGYDDPLINILVLITKYHICVSRCIDNDISIIGLT